MPEKESATGKKRILIVEDERPLAHALELKLGHEGFEPIVALSGADGLEKAAAEKFSCILLDLIMPEIDGFTFLQELREKRKITTTPVIILSNLGQEEDKAKAKAFNITDYFVKANTPIVDIVKRVKEVA
jgi:DNA-binding response OmpR family regulator